jgi:hypothetical protein
MPRYKYDKDKFLQANFRFLVSGKGQHHVCFQLIAIHDSFDVLGPWQYLL